MKELPGRDREQALLPRARRLEVDRAPPVLLAVGGRELLRQRLDRRRRVEVRVQQAVLELRRLVKQVDEQLARLGALVHDPSIFLRWPHFRQARRSLPCGRWALRAVELQITQDRALL